MKEELLVWNTPTKGLRNLHSEQGMLGWFFNYYYFRNYYYMEVKKFLKSHNFPKMHASCDSQLPRQVHVLFCMSIIETMLPLGNTQ